MGKKRYKAKLNSRRLEVALKLADNYIQDVEVKLSISCFIKELFYINREREFFDATVLTFTLKIEMFIKYFSHIRCEEINWKLLCIIMNDNIQSKLNVLITSEPKYSRRVTLLISNFKHVVLEYYIYLIEKFPTFNQWMDELIEYKNLIILEQDPNNFYITDNYFINTSIITDYPLQSIPGHFYQIEHEETNIKGEIYHLKKNINLNTSNKFLHFFLAEFIKTVEVKQALTKCFRAFCYFFESSFLSLNKTPDCFEEFNQKTFNAQYRFYRRVENSYKFNSSVNVIQYLQRFYRFLNEYGEQNLSKHEVFTLKDRIKPILLCLGYFRKFYEQGYYYVIYNKLEPVPYTDRWYLDGINIRNNSVAIVSTTNTFLDFTQIDNYQKRQDVKDFLWHCKGNITSKLQRLNVICQFINFHKNNKYIKHLFGKDAITFSNDSISSYIFYISNKYPNDATRRHIFAIVKEYLVYFRKKYNLHEQLFDLFSFKELTPTGGNPITQKDFKLIYSEFCKVRDEFEDGELLFIIFSLFSITNIRIGEILNLERNCKLTKDTIQLRRKRRGSKYYPYDIDYEAMALIEKAIAFTSPLVNKANKSKKDLQKYIFIKEYQNRIVKISSRFGSVFRKIVDKLKGQLDKHYEPYNIRHTFIDTIYDDGIKDGIPLSRLAHMAGNLPKTAIKNYRERDKIKHYVEIMAKLIISNVDINGEIIEDEKVIEQLRPVKNNSGCCGENECNSFVENETVEDDTECLRCPNFKTAVSRIPVFENNISELRKALDIETNKYRRIEKEAELRLNMAFLVKLLEVKEKRGHA